MAKYDPLFDLLIQNRADRLSLSFSRLDQIVGGLPPTAATQDAWWANEDVRTTRHSQCKAWQRAGYKASADRHSKIATFTRL